MKRLLTILVAGSALALVAGDALLGGFQAPPRAAKPHVWWHWMNGNVSKEGITADLEAMAKAGIGGAQIFDVSDGIPPGRVAFNSDLWFEMLRHANAEAKRLGVELCLANCSGWSSSGGPWVTPEDSEKEIVFAETVVKGGTTFSGVLPRAEGKEGFYRDLAVVAFPRPAAERIRAEDYLAQAPVIKGNTAEMAFAKPFPLSGVALTLAGGGRHTQSTIKVDVDCGAGWQTVVRDFVVYPTRYGFNDARIFVPAAVPQVRRVKVVCASTKGTRLVQVRPEARGRIVEEQAKTFAFRSRIVGYANPVAGEQCVDPARLQVVTSALGVDGRFTWQAPADADEWVVVRFGYSAMGQKNRPATPPGEGLEVDKFSKAALGRFFANGYIDRALRELGPVDPRGGFNALIVDSYEMRAQNWTDGFEKIFARQKGYDLLAWLPIFTGRILASPEKTDAVLADFRAVAAGLFIENYAKEFHRLCRERGLLFYLEGYGSAPCADLDYEPHCDVPMGEFWARKDQLVGNCRFAGSVAHVWGQRFVGAEAFTSAEKGRWTRDPYAYKAQGDRAFCAGINRIIYHRWAHQPWVNPSNYPGMTMGPHGSHFERTQTWWKDAAAPWLTYQARCQWMLQQGVAASDLLVVAEEKTPSCGLDLSRWHEYESVAADRYGRGIQWDLCSERALTASKVVDGKTVTPSGAVYPAVLREGKDPLPQIAPDFDCADEELVRALQWIHRRTEKGEDIYFVALSNKDAVSFEVSFRTAGRRPEVWNPERGTAQEPRAWRVEGGRTFVTLDFDPSGAAFVVFRPEPTKGLARPVAPRGAGTAIPVEGAWQVTFLDGRGAPTEVQAFPALMPWNESAEPGIRFYSGSATYTRDVVLPKDVADKGARLVLDLGEVKNVAVVTVNGRTFPTLWRPPFKVDVTEAVKGCTGTVPVSVRVTNLWPNRLMGDDALPCDAVYKTNGGIEAIPERLWKGEASPTGRHTFTTWRHWKASDKLLPSGLLGPVALVVE